MMVTATEFKNNIGKYLALADREDILITKNGKGVARLVNFRDSRMDSIRSLRGVLKGSNATAETIRRERLAERFDTAD